MTTPPLRRRSDAFRRWRTVQRERVRLLVVRLLHGLLVTLDGWLLWLDPPPVRPAPAPDPIRELARTLIAAQAAYADRSGEAKRHQVYAALIKAFPTAKHRDLGLLIEHVVQERG
jgi:hypothetical protein